MTARVYTKTGDDGTTSRYRGGRIAKTDPLIECLGDLDETVSALGVARASCPGTALAEQIEAIQRDLFVVASDLATNPDRRARLVPGVSLVTTLMTDALESLIDEHLALKPLKPVFVVPGSSPASAALDHARSIARRAERHVLVALEAGHVVGTPVTTYLNRLSDALFVLARSTE